MWNDVFRFEVQNKEMQIVDKSWGFAHDQEIDEEDAVGIKAKDGVTWRPVVAGGRDWQSA